jgi:hypothetical protein
MLVPYGIFGSPSVIARKKINIIITIGDQSLATHPDAAIPAVRGIIVGGELL